MSITAVLLLLFFLLSGHCQANVYRLGECPEAEPMKDFDMDKFVGQWYVVQKFRTAAECVKENITLDDSGEKFYLIRTERPLGSAFVSTTKSRVRFPNINDTRAVMELDSLNGLGISPDESRPVNEYVVLTTDYENFALIWGCHKMNIGHRQNAQIMSRTKTLDRKLAHELRELLHSFGISEHYLTIVNQNDCQPPQERRKKPKPDKDKDCDHPNHDDDVHKIHVDGHFGHDHDHDHDHKHDHDHEVDVDIDKVIRVDINRRRNPAFDKRFHFRLGPFHFGGGISLRK